MNPRLRFLARIVQKECRHLETTDRRLFEHPFTIERARQLESNPDLAERTEAFASRFGRLQDTLGDKLLPALLAASGETPSIALDNLDKAERLGWISSTEQWLTLCKLRNQMVHEYVEDMKLFASALRSAHEHVPLLLATANAMLAEIARRDPEGLDA
jgi:hypothetical protein